MSKNYRYQYSDYDKNRNWSEPVREERIEEKPAEEKIDKVRKKVLDLVNVREAPDGTVVGLKKKNEVVEVISERNGWSQIGKKEFIKSEFLG